MVHPAKRPDQAHLGADDPGGEVRPQPVGKPASGAAYGNGDPNSSIPQSPSYSKPASPVKMLRAALWYARRGFHIFPCHEPLFDEAGECIGCTCEAYKRSDPYRQWLTSQGKGHQFDPNYRCPNPGKHPRGSDAAGVYGFEMATTDVEQIKTWWRSRPNANIGWLPGRSGHIAVDADTYKDTYQGDQALSRADQETVTSITGGGGNHLIYRKPAGATYSNRTGDLPDGLDVRADGGYIVLAPSLHKSGRRYQWEAGYGPHELEPLPLPEPIRQMLDAATAKAQANAVQLGDASPTAPDLGRWHLSEAILDTIHNPAPRGQRSEADARVAVALVHAGASDDDILNVFAHFPIGADGKYAERGIDYLAITIGNARAFVARQQAERQAIVNEIAAGRTWLHSAAGAEWLREIGYTRIENGRKFWDSILQLCAQRGSWQIEPGYRRLGEMFNASHPAVIAHIDRAVEAGVLSIDRSTQPATLVVTASVFHNLTTCQVTVCEDGNFVKNWQDHRPDDAFLDNHGAYSKRKPDGLRPLGGPALTVITHLLDGPADVTRLGIASGHSAQSVRRALNLAHEYGLVAVDAGARNRKTYELLPEWREALEAIRPHLTTYGVLFKRKLANTDAQLRRARGNPDAHPRYIARMESRYNRLEEATTGRKDGAQWVRGRGRSGFGEKIDRKAEAKDADGLLVAILTGNLTAADALLAGWTPADLDMVRQAEAQGPDVWPSELVVQGRQFIIPQATATDGGAP